MEKRTALGAYIFGGGFTYGIQRYFNVAAHLEDDGYGVDTTRLNFPRLPIHVGYDRWPIKRYRGVDLVYGNPPCAAWSALNGKKTRSSLSWKNDVRVDCTRKHFSLLENLKPKIWLWESVDRAFSTGREFVNELTKRAVDRGYSVTHLRFDAQYVGGMHRRVRYFFIAHRVRFDWEKWIRFDNAPPLGDVLSDVSYVTDQDHLFMPMVRSHRRAYRAATPGESLQAAWDRINPEGSRTHRTSSTGRRFVVGRPPFKNVKPDLKRVCPTVVGLNLYHPTEMRFLTLAEMKALCGYPRRWKLHQTPREGQSDRLDWNVLTRAVMPPIGKWIGRLCHRALIDGHRTRGTMEVVDLRRSKIIRHDYNA